MTVIPVTVLLAACRMEQLVQRRWCLDPPVLKSSTLWTALRETAELLRKMKSRRTQRVRIVGTSSSAGEAFPFRWRSVTHESHPHTLPPPMMRSTPRAPIRIVLVSCSVALSSPASGAAYVVLAARRTKQVDVVRVDR
jgi:hypothetical protein